MEIEKLHNMLTEAGIEHEWVDRTPAIRYKRKGIVEIRDEYNWGWQILIYRPDGERLVSAIEGFGSHGYGLNGEQGDSIEILGLLTPEEAEWDTVRGWLTADEVFRRIKEAMVNGEM